MKAKPKATEAQMRDMLERVRDVFNSCANCPFCGEADFDLETGEVTNGKHESWCLYDSLMEMVL